jgi:hypothetical protein
MARERATADVVELGTDHSPFLPAPAGLAKLLMRFAAADA